MISYNARLSCCGQKVTLDFNMYMVNWEFYLLDFLFAMMLMFVSIWLALNSMRFSKFGFGYGKRK